MNQESTPIQKVAQAVGSAAKNQSSKWINERLQQLEDIVVQTSWIFFILGLLGFFTITFIVLFVASVLFQGGAPITYNAVAIGLGISLLIGLLAGFIFKMAHANSVRKKFNEMRESIEKHL